MTNDTPRPLFRFFIPLAVAALSVPACAAGTTPPAQTAQPPEQDSRRPQTASAAEKTQVAVKEAGTAILHTTEGPITVTFFPEVAPRTVQHIGALMAAGCYEGVDMFRLEPGFVVQIAPVTNQACHPDAMSTVPAEFSAVPHARLYLSMARWDDINSGTSSWSIMLGSAPSMDGQYTVFGRVIAGEETIRKIEAIGSTEAEDGMRRLNKQVLIERVEITAPIAE